MTLRALAPAFCCCLLVGCPPNVKKHQEALRERERIRALEQELELHDLRRQRREMEALVRAAKNAEEEATKTAPEAAGDDR